MVNREGFIIAISYNKLWKMLIDKGMSKTEVIRKAGISTNAMAHLGKNEDVRIAVLVKICVALDCTMNDIWRSYLIKRRRTAMVDTKKEQERDELHRAIWAIADELRGAVDG